MPSTHRTLTKLVLAAIAIAFFSGLSFAQFEGKTTTVAAKQQIRFDDYQNNYAVVAAKKSIGIFWITKDQKLQFCRVNKKGKRKGAVRTLDTKVDNVSAAWLGTNHYVAYTKNLDTHNNSNLAHLIRLNEKGVRVGALTYPQVPANPPPQASWHTHRVRIASNGKNLMIAFNHFYMANYSADGYREIRTQCLSKAGKKIGVSYSEKSNVNWDFKLLPLKTDFLFIVRDRIGGQKCYIQQRLFSATGKTLGTNQTLTEEVSFTWAGWTVAGDENGLMMFFDTQNPGGQYLQLSNKVKPIGKSRIVSDEAFHWDYLESVKTGDEYLVVWKYSTDFSDLANSFHLKKGLSAARIDEDGKILERKNYLTDQFDKNELPFGVVQLAGKTYCVFYRYEWDSKAWVETGDILLLKFND